MPINKASASRGLWVAALTLTTAVAGARDIHYGAVTDAALLECDRAEWSGQRETALGCYTNLLAVGSAAIRAEAAWALGDLKTANRWFREAAAVAADDLTLKTRWGELFAASHQDAEASELFAEVMADDPDHAFARVAGAELADGRFDPAGIAALNTLLDDDQAPAGARLRTALVLAHAALERGDRAEAEATLTRAAELAQANDWPELDILALRVALDVLAGNEDSAHLERGLAINPGYGRLFTVPAHFLVITRRYRPAIRWLERAVEVDAGLAAAHEALGVNLLRDNRMGAAREHLETAHDLDPFSPVAVNTLRLLDSFTRFRVVTDTPAPEGPYAGQPPLEIRLRNDEADVLAPLTAALTREAIDVFTERYGFALREAVVIELYPDHEDFAVRTAGLPGLGILGATFGYLLAMDSPSGRSVEQFQWGTVLWHELAHVFTLEATNHLVPRWFSEGVSVFEEWRSGPNPGVRVPPNVWAAIAADKLLPIASLDEGFVRPTYPNQVIVSYMQAGLICEFLAERFGDKALRDMLTTYADGGSTASAIQTATALSTTEFDRAFGDWLSAGFGALYEDLDGWRQLSRDAKTAFDNARYADAIEAATAAVERYPGYVEADSAWLTLARAQTAMQQTDAALATYALWQAQGGYDPDATTAYAELLRDVGQSQAGAEALASLDWVTPLDGERHLRLGRWWLEEGQAAAALAAIDRALALTPHDRAEALYLRARAQKMTGANAAARESLLDALEIAPAYRDAQKLLLELVRGGS